MSKQQNFAHLGAELNIAYLQCDDLKPHQTNARTHSPKQLQQIANSIKEFGFTNPILIDTDYNIIAGHGRVEAARLIDLKQIPVIYLHHLTEAQKRAYMIADNKLAENAGWDFELLESELNIITKLDLDFDLSLTGFEPAEIDFMLSHKDNEEADENIPTLPVKPITKLGDIWHLGPHKIICGDAMKAETYERLMGKEKARMVFTDPPYNVPVSGHVCGKGKVKHDEFAMASGEMSSAQFTTFLKSCFENLCAYSHDGSLHYVCMDWRHMEEILAAGKTYTELKNLCVWNKTNGGMGSLYRSKHELVFVFKHGKKPHLNNIELGKNGRYRTNVWDYAGVNTFGKTKDLEMHPTVKPVAMFKDAILDCSKRGDIILDAFGGSGSTLIAAEQAGRKARLIELDPKYVDVTIRRYQELTGKAVTDENGEPFNPKQEISHG